MPWHYFEAMTDTIKTATPTDTIKALLNTSKRSHVPIRNVFVQQGEGKKRQPGPLKALLSTSNARSLDLYLLILAKCSAAPFDVTLEGHEVWARALAVSAKSASTAVSKSLGRLERLSLISRVRKGRRCQITLLNESGDGTAYDKPKKRYFRLPHEYWTENWHQTLSMPAKTALLIALSLNYKSPFRLPTEKGPDWYGISSDSLQRGLKELCDRELLDRTQRPKTAPLSKRGFTLESFYSLNAPFQNAHATKGAKVLTLPTSA